MFLAQGFDAASMNDIARAAGVSKGTLYVYFKHKEQLFEAIIEQECEGQAEGIFDLDPNDHDVEAVLTRLGNAYARFLCRPEKASAIRTVIAIADRMPDLGRKFYETRPGTRHRAACGLYRGAGQGRRAGRRGLRNRRGATDGSLPGDAVQIDDIQLRARAEPRSKSNAWCGSRSRPFSRPIVRQGRSQSRHCEERKRRSNPGFRSQTGLLRLAPNDDEKDRALSPTRRRNSRTLRLRARDRIAHVDLIALPEESVVDVEIGAVGERQQYMHHHHEQNGVRRPICDTKSPDEAQNC